MEQKKGQAGWAGFTIHAVGLSALGKVRAVNEDGFWFEMAVPVFCVADGAGGYESGDVARAMDEAENRLHVQKALMMNLLGADQ